MKFCSHCGEHVIYRVPDGDDRPRFTCNACGTIHYQNPRIVVGTIPEWNDRILLCRRAIEPRHGLWTLPAGYLEIGETTAEGAARETMEEAGATVKDLSLFTIIDLTFVQQIYMMWRATMALDRFAPGAESLDVGLFTEAEIPWDRLAFPVIRRTLECYFEDRTRGRFHLHTESMVPEHRIRNL